MTNVNLTSVFYIFDIDQNCLGEMIIVKTMFSFLIFLDLMAVIHLLSVEWQGQSEIHEQNTDLNRFAMCL